MNIKHQLDHKFIKIFERTEERLKLLEQTVFGAEGSEFRFDKIEKVQEKLLKDHVTHYELHCNQTSQLETRLSDEVFKISQKILKLEGYGTDIANLVEKDKKIEKSMQDSFEKLKKDEIVYKSQIKMLTEKNDQRIQKFTQDQWMVKDRMEKVEEYQQMQSKYKTEMD